MTRKEDVLDSLPLVLTVKEVAEVLQIGRETAYELLRSGQIESKIIAHKYRIPRWALLRYIGENE